MIDDGAPLDLRPGVRVRYRPAHSAEWREARLVRPSPDREEWLVRTRFGDFWIHVTRLRSLEGEAT